MGGSGEKPQAAISKLVTVERGDIVVAYLGGVLLIKHGLEVGCFPASAREQILEGLEELGPYSPKASDGPGSVLPTALQVVKDESSQQPSRRRGRLWAGIKKYLNSKERPQGFNSMLRVVKSEKLTTGDPIHALKVMIGKKVAVNELRVTNSGRYALVERDAG